MKDARQALLDVFRTDSFLMGGQQSGGSHGITWETVQAVNERGEFVVRGVVVPGAGKVSYTAGARVPVAWKNGRPVAVLGHRWRRAQFHPHSRQTGQGIIEELLIGNFDNTETTVWYRNFEKLEKLVDASGQTVRTLLGAQQPTEVKWGLDGASFGVTYGAGGYAVFTFDRDNPNAYDPEFPSAVTKFWSGTPLKTNAPLSTVTWRDERTLTYKYYTVKVTQREGPWVPVQAAWFNGGLWYWSTLDRWDIQHGWDTSGEPSATATASVTEVFGIQDALRGKKGYNDMGLFSGRVLEWFLDADKVIKFLFEASWDYYVGGSTNTATGTGTMPFGAGPYGMDPWNFQVSVAAGRRTIGAKKRSDFSTVPETHVFLIDSRNDSVLWSTAGQAVTYGRKGHETAVYLRGHYFSHTPAKPSSSGLPNPHVDDPGAPPVDTESYYGGANWINWQVGNYWKNVGNIGDDRPVVDSSVGTMQLLDPSRTPFIAGPFRADLGKWEYQQSMSILLPWPWGGGNYILQFSVTLGGYQQLWFYRTVSAKLFARRASGGGIDEALCFLVMERYPFISGTGYINDLPQTGVFVIRADGSVVRTLRPFAYGYFGAGMQAVSGNGHRLIWVLASNPLSPTYAYYVTNLDTGEEAVFDAPRVNAFLQAKARLFTPDFLWDRLDPQAFDLPASLPTLEEDEVLQEYASLLQTEGAPEGSVRIVNDEAILSPLERYRTV